MGPLGALLIFTEFVAVGCSKPVEDTDADNEGAGMRFWFLSILEFQSGISSIMLLSLGRETPFRQKWFEVVVAALISLGPLKAHVMLMNSFAVEDLIMKKPWKRSTHVVKSLFIFLVDSSISGVTSHETVRFMFLQELQPWESFVCWFFIAFSGLHLALTVLAFCVPLCISHARPPAEESAEEAKTGTDNKSEAALP